MNPPLASVWGKAKPLCLAMTLITPAAFQGEEARGYSEQREPCAHFTPTKRPLFGDLHVHTRLSFDAFLSGQKNDPSGAYRYAKGEPIVIADADNQQTVTAQISRPLDFAAVTDHSEYLGETSVCQDPSVLGYWWPTCILARSDSLWPTMIAASLFESENLEANVIPQRSWMCDLPGVDCEQAMIGAWDIVQHAAEEHYDRSDACEFTTFVGYEYTDHPERKNMHRNVIYRNANVSTVPASVFNTGTYNFPDLWTRLRESCIDAQFANGSCDVMAIPHNPNLSGGLMFRDPETEQEANDRIFFEPLVEIVQHKASSECRFDRLSGLGVDTEDELCDFEQAQADNMTMMSSVEGKLRSPDAKPVAIEDFGRRNMVRNVLKDGLALEQQTGQNPFKIGFIGSTDTHSATAGGAEEDNYLGHLGRRDSGYRNIQDHFYDNPGGLAVVWAEENSRDAIFNAMRNKETYATSGTRPTVRFFAGYDYKADICDSPDMLQQAYAGGVPMGGTLEQNSRNASPNFLVAAMKDPGLPRKPGTDIQRVQIIKGWLDSDGQTHEKVFDIAGTPNNGATVDRNTCAPIGQGVTAACTVWRDPEFNPADAAFYYVRVLENPTCRWSTLQCKAAGVDPFSPQCSDQAQMMNEKAVANGAVGDVYSKCCTREEESAFYSPVIQERAWTSPIWYAPKP